jgi:serine acetyltransferase
MNESDCRRIELTRLRADWESNRGYPKARLILTIFRLGRHLRRGSVLERLIALPIRIVYRIVVEWVFAVELPWSVEVDGGLKLEHPTGIVIHPRVRIGAGVTIKQNVTLGVRGSNLDPIGVPSIGDGCIIGSGAQIIGGIHLGVGARIGAGAVVLQNIPNGATAVGNPARIIPRHPGATSEGK